MEKTGFGGLEAWFLEPSLGSKQQLELTGMKKSGDHRRLHPLWASLVKLELWKWTDEGWKPVCSSQTRTWSFPRTGRSVRLLRNGNSSGTHQGLIWNVNVLPHPGEQQITGMMGITGTEA